MNSEDVRELRLLSQSVYLTVRQKEALGRALRQLAPGSMAMVGGVVLTSTKTGAELLEDQRHALLGPCGAE